MDNSAYPLPRETRESAIFVGNGGSTYGPFAFKIFDTADVKVFVKHAGSARFVAASGVTVTKTSNAAFDTFSIAFGAVVAATSQIKVLARRLHERAVAPTLGGALHGAELDKELSKQGTVIDELRRDVDQCLQADFGVTPPKLIETIRESYSIVGSADGGWEEGPTTAEIAAAASHAAAALAARLLAEAAEIDAAAWATLARNDQIPQFFTGNGVQTAFVLTVDPGTAANCLVIVDGLPQLSNSYSVAGTTLTFSEPPPGDGVTMNIEVRYGFRQPVGTPADGSVTEPKLGLLSVTTAKLADGSVTEPKLGLLSVTTAKLADGSVTESKLGLLSVITAKLADLAVTTAKLADLAVTTVKLAAGAVTLAKLDPAILIPAANLSIPAPTRQAFAAGATWTKPAGLKYAKVTCVGPGGGGGGCTGAVGAIYEGGGGGGGETAVATIPAATLGATETVTVGTGGAGGATGNNNGAAGSGDTSFGAHVVAKPGAGANYGAVTQGGTGGLGGTGGTGQLKIPGGAGASGIYATIATVLIRLGRGGLSTLGVPALSATVNGNGAAGNGPGAGGNGGWVSNTATTAAGGAGQNGVCIVEEYY